MKKYLKIVICLGLALVAGCNLVKKEDKETFSQKNYRLAIKEMKKTEDKYGNVILYEEEKLEKDKHQWKVKRYPFSKQSTQKDLEKRIKYHNKKIKFCKAFYKDFMNNKNLEIVEPVVRTDDYKDKKLGAYLNKCPKIKKDLKEIKRFDKVGGVTISSFDFRVYDIDFDNMNNGYRSNIMYRGGNYNKEKNEGQLYDGYSVIDFNKCKRLTGGSSPEMFDYFTRERTGNIGGVIKYKGDYYFYYVYKDDSIALKKYEYVDKVKNFNHRMDDICWFHKDYKVKTKGSK